MATELYNQLHPGQAESAGTIVDMPGQTLQAAHAVKTIAVMGELGVDVTKNTRRQVTPHMLAHYDKVIVLSEPENTPEWLRAAPNAEVWTIQDTKDTTLDRTREIRDELKTSIADM